MSSRIFPPWEEINRSHNPLTPGERKLLEFLDEHLPEGWMIFSQPFLNGSRPDIVIFNPIVGVMIYEVKDWDLNAYEYEDGKLFVKDKFGGEYLIKSPLKQVDHYRKEIIELLIPSIGEAIDEDSKVLTIIKTGVYFHKVDGTKARQFFHNPKYPSVFGYNDLIPQNISLIVPDYSIRKSKYMKEEWARELEFWLNPPFHDAEQRQTIKLTPKQQEHATPKPGHFRLRGPAGSGKTLVIAYRAAQLASKGYKVLIITYNITLWHYIRDMIARTPFKFNWNNIAFYHFHGFCNQVLNHFAVPPPTEDVYFKEIVSTVRKTIDKKGVGPFKYDAILIDEGQDFEWEWYDLLCNFLTKRDELLLVCDKQQNIYKRDLRWVDGQMRNVKFRGRWRELDSIHRLPEKIYFAAREFSKMFGLSEIHTAKAKVIPPQLFGNAQLIWKDLPSSIETCQILQCLANAYNWAKSDIRKNKSGHPSDIVILLPTHELGLKAVDYFENHLHIKVNHVFEKDETIKRHKKSFWLGDSRIKMCTIHSFKGWESLYVILFIPSEWPDDFNLDAIVYTAITRTRKTLIVLNCNERYLPYSKLLKAKSLSDSIRFYDFSF